MTGRRQRPADEASPSSLGSSTTPSPAGDRMQTPSAKLSRVGRLVSLTLALVPLVLLAVAGALEPSEQGLGTHQQLGLPPCSFRMLVGQRCPACGMTTSWAHFADGDWVSSMAANAGGFWLALYSLAFAACAIEAAWTSRWPGAKKQQVFGGGLLVIAGITLTEWGLRTFDLQ